MDNSLIKKNILLVEDDKDIRSLYINKLYIEGFNVYPVGDGKQALVTLHNQVIDLIILDIILPGGINGFEFLETVKKDPQRKNIPIIIFTNLDSERNTAMEMGVSDYILKTSVTPDDFVGRMRAVLDKKV